MVLVGYRYSPSQVPTQYPTTPGTPPPPLWLPVRRAGPDMQVKEAVGLKSVAQLSLRPHFSGFRGITEVYNLDIAGNPNDHKFIPGKD